MNSPKSVNEQNHEHDHAQHEHEQVSLVELKSVDMEETKSWQRVVSVSLPDSEWQKACADQLIQVRRKVTLPGFRKGKAPKDMIEQQFSGQITVDAMEYLLPRAWQQAMHELGAFYPINDPEFADIEYGEGKDFSFKATVEVRPEIEIKGHKGMKVTWYKEPVPEDGVSRTLDSIREDRADFKEAERAATDGDRITADFRQVDEDGNVIIGTEIKGHLFELGAPNILNEFSDGVRGLAAGAEKRFPVNYPKDFEQESLAGETRNFQVTVQKVEEKVLPELDDAFAAELGDYEDMAQLEKQIGENITAEIEQRNRGRLEAALIQGLLAINEFEVPPSMVERYTEHMIKEQEQRGGNELGEEERKKAMEELKPGSELSLKRWFVKEAVGRQEKIEVTDEDFEKHLSELAASSGEELDKIRDSVKRSQAEGRVREDILHGKIFTFLREQAKIKEETMPLPDEAKGD